MMALAGAGRRAICSRVARHLSTGCGKEPGVLGHFDYERPRTIEDAARLLAELPSDAALLAGGTDLLVELRSGRPSPRLLVDVKRLDVLRQLVISQAGAATIGATVSLNEILEHPRLRKLFPGLTQAAESIATYPLRNRATAVGNLCHASPAADLAPILLALDASVVVRSLQGERALRLAQFFTGVKRTAMRPGEVATEIRIPAPASGLRSGFLKQQRLRGHDLAVANVAGTYEPKTGVVRLAFGSCAPTPVALAPMDVRRVSPVAAAEEAARAALAAASPISDVRASAEYRRSVLPVLVRRLVEALLKGGPS